MNYLTKISSLKVRKELPLGKEADLNFETNEFPLESWSRENEQNE